MTFENDEQRATAYAAYKYLEDLLKGKEQIKAGSSIDVSGRKIEITLPPGTIINRSEKETALHKATQNLNGLAVLAAIVERLRKFNQWNIIRASLITAVRAAVKKDTSTELQLVKIDPEFNAEIEKLRDEMALASREQVAPNRMTRSEMPITMTFRKPAK